MFLLNYIVFCLFLLLSCVSTKGKKNTLSMANSHPGYSEAAWRDCVRGEPVPVLDSTILRNWHFKLKRHVAIESGRLLSGDEIQILHAGCEYYVLDFQVRTKRFNGDPADVKYWLSALKAIASEARPSIDVPFHLPEAVNALQSHYESSAQNQFNQNIDFGAADIRSVIALKGVQSMKKGEYYINISVSMGPLYFKKRKNVFFTKQRNRGCGRAIFFRHRRCIPDLK